MEYIKKKANDYYESHHLSDIYNQYNELNKKANKGEFGVDEFDNILRIFRLSKQIEAPKKRLEVLKKIFESWEEDYRHYFNTERYEELIKFDRLNIDLFKPLLDGDVYPLLTTLNLINLTIDKSIKINKLSEIAEFNEELINFKYPSSLSEVGLYKSKYKFEIIKTLKDSRQISKHYHSCWHAYHSPSMIKGDFFLINIKKDNNLIGTIRFKKKGELWNMAGWSNHIDGKEETKCWQFAKKDLKNIALFIYKETKNEIFNIKNLELEYHLGKRRISKSLNNLHTELNSKKRIKKL